MEYRKTSLAALIAAVALGVAALVAPTHAIAKQDAPAPESATVDGLRISEMVTASELEGGVPVSPVAAFTRGDGRIYCFVRVENRSRAETAIRVSFESAGRELRARRGGVRLAIPARWRYRTFARIPASRAAGNYRCVARAESGEVLRSVEFSVTE